MGAEHPPAKSRPPGDCVAPQTGGLRAEKTRVQLPRRLLVSFEHMQHRESFGVTTAKWPPCPSRCRRARRVRALCQSGFRLSRRSRRLPGSFETIDPITALPMASTPYRLRAEPPQPRRTRAPRDGQNNGQPGVFRTGCREDELYNVAGTAHWRLLRDDAIAHAFGHELGVNKVMSYFTSPRFIKKGI